MSTQKSMIKTVLRRFPAGRGAAVGAILVTATPLAIASGVAIYSLLTTAANTVANWVYVTPDSDPNQIYMVTPNGTPNGINAADNNHPIGVWFDNRVHNWGIFNQDQVNMPLGTGFNVWSPQSASNVYTHKSAVANTRNFWTYLDNVWLNSNPNALIWVTPNWNPGGRGSGVYNPHTVGVWYDRGVSRWAIFNEDGAAMPTGSSFNIVAEAGEQYPYHFVVACSISNPQVTLGIDSKWCNNYPYAQIFATPVYNPGGTVAGVINNSPVIVRYNVGTGRWYLQNQNGQPFSPGAAFNVWVVSHA